MQVDCPRCGHLLEFSRQPPRFCSACGQPLRPSEPGATRALDPDATLPALAAQAARAPEPPAAVGGYALLRPLGGGGMGTVYEAEERGTGRRVALKLIRPEFADSPEAVERFRREGRLAGAVSHPRCVFVLAADEEAGQPYIVMELMPGSTLLDLVDRRGPLPVPEAVALILDVLDGLEEAHRCGVVHRDVKPSNCFLDPDGRVKVGDFGLSKSLLQPQQLTRSGAFLGTVLYAAPEQIRNDSVDHRADVYSACATLYFLLTGRAPFEGGDPAETLARTLTDPLTPMRAFRPDVPRTLDEVVLRGLARNRSRRWQSLEELRLALVPFVTAPHSLAELGWRCVAYVCDAVFLTVLLVLLGLALRPVVRPLLEGGLARTWLSPGGLPSWGTTALHLLLGMGWSLLCGLAYFALPEALWGCSAGKYLCRLRVRTVPANDRPTLWRSCLRTAVFYLFKDSGWFAAELILGVGMVRLVSRPGGITPSALASAALLALLALLVLPLGFVILASTMRRRNGYRGVHEFLSGTMVIRLPAARPLLTVPASDAEPPNARPGDLPDRLGPFAVRGELCRAGEEAVLLGEDPGLGRQVWIWVRPGGGPLSAARRSVSRGTRPRWLAGGEHEGRHWDAFVASPGCLLADLVVGGRRLPWPEAFRLLERLTDELTAARAERTLPERLGVHQVWVTPPGRVQLLDVPLRGGPAGSASPEAEERQRALDLLRQVAVLALEGRPAAPGEPPRPIRAPVPGHAAEFLGRLAGARGSFADPGEVRAALSAAGEAPADVTPPRRALHLTALGGLLALGLLWTFGFWPLLTASLALMTAWAHAEESLEALDAQVRAECAGLIASPGTPGRLAAAGPLASDLDLRDRLAERLRRAPGADVLLRSSSGFVREALSRADLPPAMEEGLGPRRRAELAFELLEPAGDLIGEVRSDPLGGVLWLLPWPAVWVVWAFLTRGGLSLRLAGIRLLQADGRPAARWRCAWRALLVWAPVALLVLASVYLDVWRISGALASGDPDARAWCAWVAWLAWWLALALLPAYALLALRHPARGPHDRLAGTYLVPR
jgi:eukaryotic-like serine/threonine-protein kinase